MGWRRVRGRLSEARSRVARCATCTEARGGAALPQGELGQPTPEEERLLAPPGRSEIARGLLALNHWLFGRCFRRGRRPPASAEGGPYLMTPNHTSYLDPFTIASVLPWPRLRNLHWAGWVDLLFVVRSRACSARLPGVAGRSGHGLTST
jgi:long-chain acyl-CoA synthetase